jgi:protein involved in polysaccharide export with SLBB domain
MPFPCQRRSRWVAGCLVVVALASTTPAGAQTTAEAPAHGGDAVAAHATRSDSAGAIAPGDRVLLRVAREPTWSDSLVVAPDGMIVLPRVGLFHAAGLTPIALRDSISGRLAVYLREPVVDVVVLRRVAVLGSVRKPNVLYVDPVTSLRDVIAQAGGVDDVGDVNRIDVVRDGVSTRLGPWDQVAPLAAPVRSGDEVIVGKRPWYQRNPLAAASSVVVAVSVLITALRK